MIKLLRIVAITLLVTLLFSTVAFSEEANNIPDDVAELISLAEEMIVDDEIYGEVKYNALHNHVVISIAPDGYAAYVLSLVESERESYFVLGYEYWADMKEAMLYASQMLRLYADFLGLDDLDILFQVVNDDAYIRNDYSSVYSPLFLAIKNGEIYFDIIDFI